MRKGKSGAARGTHPRSAMRGAAACRGVPGLPSDAARRIGAAAPPDSASQLRASSAGGAHPADGDASPRRGRPAAAATAARRMVRAPRPAQSRSPAGRCTSGSDRDPIARSDALLRRAACCPTRRLRRCGCLPSRRTTAAPTRRRSSRPWPQCAARSGRRPLWTPPPSTSSSSQSQGAPCTSGATRRCSTTGRRDPPGSARGAKAGSRLPSPPGCGAHAARCAQFVEIMGAMMPDSAW